MVSDRSANMRSLLPFKKSNQHELEEARYELIKERTGCFNTSYEKPVDKCRFVLYIVLYN